jgi:glucokinase
VTTCLLADVGGTWARFALLSGSTLGPICALPVGAYASAVDAITHFMHRETDGVAVDGALIAAAGPVAGGRCALTNSPWVLESEKLTRAFGLSTVEIVNDLEALAWAIPYLKSADCEAIGGGQERAGEPIVIIAPGTGLGMACRIPGPGGKRVLASEGGHATLAAANEEEAELIEVLRWRYGHVSAERALSGQGLMNLHQAIADRQALPVETRSAEQITRAAIDGRCRQSQLALDVFCSLLGSVAGNAALMFGARGGVYLGGGIAPRIFGYMRRSGFRAQFESKGRFREYLGRIPTRVIVRADPTFLGLQALATRRD